MPMMVVGSASHSPQVWGYNKSFRRWQILRALEGHTGPINDVSWAPRLGRSFHYIASGSQDKTVRIWKVRVGGDTSVLESYELDQHDAEVWSVEWNVTGNTLASTGDDGTVRLWKLSTGGTWVCQRSLIAEEEGKEDEDGQ